MSKFGGTTKKVQHGHNWNTRKRREKGTEEIFETIMTENFPRLMSDTKPSSRKLRIHQARQMPKTTTPRHIIFKL